MDGERHRVPRSQQPCVSRRGFTTLFSLLMFRLHHKARGCPGDWTRYSGFSDTILVSQKLDVVHGSELRVGDSGFSELLQSSYRNRRLRVCYMHCIACYLSLNSLKIELALLRDDLLKVCIRFLREANSRRYYSFNSGDGWFLLEGGCARKKIRCCCWARRSARHSDFSAGLPLWVTRQAGVSLK